MKGYIKSVKWINRGKKTASQIQMPLNSFMEEGVKILVSMESKSF